MIVFETIIHWRSVKIINVFKVFVVIVIMAIRIFTMYDYVIQLTICLHITSNIMIIDIVLM